MMLLLSLDTTIRGLPIAIVPPSNTDSADDVRTSPSWQPRTHHSPGCPRDADSRVWKHGVLQAPINQVHMPVIASSPIIVCTKAITRFGAAGGARSRLYIKSSVAPLLEIAPLPLHTTLKAPNNFYSNISHQKPNTQITKSNFKMAGETVKHIVGRVIPPLTGSTTNISRSSARPRRMSLRTLPLPT